MKNKYFYIYKIVFEDGYYYIGRRTCSMKPELDVDYFGTPFTHKDKWKTTKFTKIILEEVYDSTTLGQREEFYIGDNYKNDNYCLNEHNSKNINPTSTKGRHWWNNGIEEKLQLECPYGNGWCKGRLPGRTLSRTPRTKKWHYNVVTGEELYCNNPPSDQWIKGKPSQSLRQLGKKKPNTSKALKGKPKSPEHKQKLSEYKIKNRDKMTGINNPMSNPEYRRRHNEACSAPEHRKKISDGVKRGRWSGDKKKQHSDTIKQKYLDGYTNPNSKKLEINGKIYYSIKDAMEALNKSRNYIKNNATFL